MKWLAIFVYILGNCVIAAEDLDVTTILFFSAWLTLTVPIFWRFFKVLEQ